MRQEPGERDPSYWTDLAQRLQQRFDGTPLHSIYPFRITALRTDHAELSLSFLPQYDNGNANIHGGILAMLADTAIACALATAFDGRMGFATANLTIHFLRRARTDVRAVANITRRGGTVCTGIVTLYDASGCEVALATSDFILTSARAPRSQLPSS